MMLSKNESKFIKSLKLKKYRQQERCFLVEGEKNIEEVLRSDMLVRYIVGTEEFLQRLESKNLVLPTWHIVKQTLLESLSSLKTNQSGLAIVEMPKESTGSLTDNHILALDNVNDPGNLGTIIRTMDWFGFGTLLCSHESADFYNPKTIAATMCSFTRIIPKYVDLPETLASLRADGHILHGLVLDGEPMTLRSITKGVFIMGSESHGISKAVLSVLDRRCTISSYGQAESLNVAIATAIVLHEIRRP